MVMTVLSTLLYLLCGAGFAWRLWAGPARVPWRHALLVLTGIGVMLHGAGLGGRMDAPGGLDLGFFNALSLVAALMVLTVLLGALRRPLENLMVLVLPVAAGLQLTGHLVGGDVATITRFPAGLELHVGTSILAFSVLSVAVVQSLVLAWQESRLRHRHPGGLVRLLPPLQEMERLLFQMVRIGFLLLSLALLSGMLYLDDLFGQHLAHKTAFSLLAWALFAILLFGRWRWGWRGRIAVRWTLGAFILLLLAYFGSKLVLELILGRG